MLPDCHQFAFRTDDFLADLINQHPAAFAILDQLGISCSGEGEPTLLDIAQQHDLEPLNLLEQLALKLPTAPVDNQHSDPSALTIDELIDYVERQHHVYTRREIGRITVLVERSAPLVTAHYDELVHSATAFCSHVLAHLQDEETHIFPLGRALEQRQRSDGPQQSIESYDHDCIAAEHDHASFGIDLAAFKRALSAAEFAPAGQRHQHTLAAALGDLTTDLGIHSHVEEEYLLPAVAYALEIYQQNRSW